MNKIELAAKIAAMKTQQPAVIKPAPIAAPVATPAKVSEIKTNLSETPAILKQLLGIVETIEESNDTSEIGLMKASEQVEKCKAYILYLKSILPILEAKTEAMIEAKHKPQPIEIQGSAKYTLN